MPPADATGAAALGVTGGIASTPPAVRLPIDAPRNVLIDTINKLIDDYNTRIERAYPIGSIYINASVATDPRQLFGFGTWERYGKGRVLVSQDSAQTEFDVLGETGGQKDLMAHSHNIPTFGGAAGGSYEVGGGSGQFSTSYDYTPAAPTTTTGSGVNNMNPYIVVYVWRRIG